MIILIYYTKYFINDELYYVSTNGKIYTKKFKEASQRENSDGYLTITAGKSKRSRIRVHTVIADAFIGKDNPSYEVNHIDLNRKNNNIENLEYLTHIENVRHSSELGRYKNKSGINNGRSKINYEDAKKIREMYSNNISISKISKIYNIGWSTVKHIVDFDTWNNAGSQETIGDECSQVR